MAIEILPHITPKTTAAFAARAGKQDGCWEWSGLIDGAGYARISLNRNLKIGAHRFSYAMHYGVEPGNLFVCHRCDNPRCTNPEHLFLGTPLDNTKDMFSKGRQGRFDGEKNPRVILTEEDVENIKVASAAWMSNTELGQLYGVTHSTISAIKRGKTWHKIGTVVVVPEFSSHASR